MTIDSTPKDLAASLTGRHRELVRYLRVRLPSDDDAQDLAQEAYLRLLRLSDDHMIRHPEAYLFRIASNLIHEFWLSSRVGSVETLAEPDDLPSQVEQPEVLASQEQALSALGQAIKLLSPIQRSVVILHRRDGKTYEEIATELNISRDMVKKHLGKALARCREYMILRKHDY